MATVKFKELEEVFRNLNKEIKALEDRTQAGVTLAAQHIRRQAVKKTPVVTGNLRNSVFVTTPKAEYSNASFKGKEAFKLSGHHALVISQSRGRLGGFKHKPSAEIGFSAVYAGAVHENPRSGKTGGVSPQGKAYKAKKGSREKAFSTVGEWKFLETTMREEAKTVLKIIREKARIKK